MLFGLDVDSKEAIVLREAHAEDVCESYKIYHEVMLVGIYAVQPCRISKRHKLLLPCRAKRRATILS